MKQSPIKKAVIPAAGLGTRFLPVTKTIPKEMLPIVDTPTLLMNVEEAVEAGIEDIIIVAGRNKTEIEDFFDHNYELEVLLESSGKLELLKKIQSITEKANIISIRQKKALGLGHAVYTAKPIVGNEPFAVLLGDEISLPLGSVKASTPCLVELYEELGTSVVSVLKVPPNEVSRYGIIDAEDFDRNRRIFKVRQLVEKPRPEEAPSQWALPGRYVFDAAIFQHIENQAPGALGEIQLTDAMSSLAKIEGLFASNFENRRFDAGDRLGFLQANIELGLEHAEIGEAFKSYLKEFVSKL